MTNQDVIEQVKKEVSQFKERPALVAVRFDAPNDPNGKPRRIWLVKYPITGVLGDLCAIDVSYNGNSYLWEIFPSAMEFCTVAVNANAYEELFKEFQQKGRLIL